MHIAFFQYLRDGYVIFFQTKDDKEVLFLHE